jgi:hypothetical protein
MISTDKRLTNAIALVQSRGLIVSPPPAERFPWMTPSELFARYLGGTTKSRMYRRLAGSSAPCVDGRWGESGRLIAVRATPKLIAYLQQPSQQGRRL